MGIFEWRTYARQADPALAAAAALLLLTTMPAGAETILVSNEKGNSITVLDAGTLAVIKTVPVGQRPRGIVLSQDKRALYICASDDDDINVLDLDTYSLREPLPSGPDPETFALHPDGQHLYISNEDDSLVSIVDIKQRQVVGEIAVGVEPEGMGISPDEIREIFKPFYRASQAQAVSGVGIGLTVCERLVEAQGGAIWAEPREGGGTTIAFGLRATAAAVDPPEA